jgi:cof-like hydrolase
MIKLIVSDMDGTLLNTNHEFPKDFMRLFKALQQREITFCVASGRQYTSLLQFFAPIKEQMSFIAQNGTLLMRNDKVLYENTLSVYHLQRILSVVKPSSQVAVGLYSRAHTYLFPTTPYAESQVRIYNTSVIKVRDLSEVPEPISQVSLYDPINARTNTLPTLSVLAQEGLTITLSGTHWIDITNAGANKGEALVALQKALEITPEQTMAFGDHLNDIQMMRQASFSYAMKNAEEEVKAVANYITEKDNNENGVLKTIDKKLNLNLFS